MSVTTEQHANGNVVVRDKNGALLGLILKVSHDPPRFTLYSQEVYRDSIEELVAYLSPKSEAKPAKPKRRKAQ